MDFLAVLVFDGKRIHIKIRGTGSEVAEAPKN